MKTTELDAAIEAARRAATVIEDMRAKITVRAKGRADLVTEADEAAQNIIRSTLFDHFPDYQFFGEEGPKGARPDPNGPPTWIVDPIDGTTNYIHGLPLYGISIGLLADRRLKLGVILDPRHNELFTAELGRGAWLNGQRLQVSTTDDIGDALLTVGFAPDLRGKERQLEIWNHFSLTARGMRRTGSTTINLSYLAAGRFDGYWAFDLNVWDLAAGVVLVQEAGGRVTNIGTDDFDPFRPDMVASNGLVHEVIQRRLTSVN